MQTPFEDFSYRVLIIDDDDLVLDSFGLTLSSKAITIFELLKK